MHQDFGIRELYVPETKPEVDIVAIHGLNGDGLKTWTSASSKVCWLNDPELLPKYVKNARVLTYTYNANVTTVTGRSTSSDRIMQHAQTLIAELCADRALMDAEKRPIIFICHSLGGTIVKRALAYSKGRTARNIAHLHSIYTCTFGILFFGTPHAGSSKAAFFSNLTKLAAFGIPKKVAQLESGLVEALKEDSETLQNITDHFAPLLPRFNIYFFWEQETTDIGYTKAFIVEESSAAPILDNTERSGIAANHQGMCKFQNSQSPGFRVVVSVLKRYCTEAPTVIEARLNQAARQLKEGWVYEATEVQDSFQRPAATGKQRLLLDGIHAWTDGTAGFPVSEANFVRSNP